LLFRSASLRLGEMLNSPLVESHLNPAKTVIADRLQWARSSIRKRLDMNDANSSIQPEDKDELKSPSAKMGDTPFIDLEPTTGTEGLVNGNHKEKPKEPQQSVKNDSLSNGSCEDESTSSSSCTSPLQSPERLTLTHGDPLGALDSSSLDAVQSSPTTPQVEPVRRLNSSFVVPDPEGRLFINTHPSSSSSASEDDSSDASSDGSSSTESDTDSEEESDDHSHDYVPSSASKLPFRYHRIVRMSFIFIRFWLYCLFI